MDYNDIPLFVAVVEAGSFTGAASKLGMQKSSVSRSIARLEEDLGVRLLQRTTRHLAPTDAGQAFFDRVRGAVAGVDDARAAVQELGNEPRGTVRVTAPADAATLGVASAIATFVEKYPKIRVDLVLTSRTVDLVAEGFDLAIRAGKLSDSTLVARKVGTTELALFASPAYLSRRGTPKRLAELARHDCVLFREPSGRGTWTLEGPDGPDSVEVTGSVSADDLQFIAGVVAAGAGVSVLPVPLAGTFVKNGALVRILSGYRVIGNGVHLVLPTAAFVPSRVALLRDHLSVHLTKAFEEAKARCAAHEPPSDRRRR